MWEAAVVLISWTNEAQIRQLVPGPQPILHDTTLFYFYVITFQKKKSYLRWKPQSKQKKKNWKKEENDE